MKPGFLLFCRERQCQKSGNGFPQDAAGSGEKRQGLTKSRRQKDVILMASPLPCAPLVAWHLAITTNKARPRKDAP